MTHHIDLPAIRRRADAADVPALCDEVERLRELVRRAYLEGFCDGEQAERPANTDADYVGWNKSSSKKDV